MCANENQKILLSIGMFLAIGLWATIAVAQDSNSSVSTLKEDQLMLHANRWNDEAALV
jgi:hypothetical protein